METPDTKTDGNATDATLTQAPPAPPPVEPPPPSGTMAGADVEKMLAQGDDAEAAAEKARLERAAKMTPEEIEAERAEMEKQHLAEEAERQAAAAADAPLPKHIQDELDAAQEKLGLRTDGPTLAEFVSMGNDPAEYPPRGYAVVTDEMRAAENPDHPLAQIFLLKKRVEALELKIKHWV